MEGTLLGALLVLAQACSSPVSIGDGSVDAGSANVFRLAPTSPAVDKASKEFVRDSWTDFDANEVPCGNAPDIGTVEFCQ